MTFPLTPTYSELAAGHTDDNTTIGRLIAERDAALARLARIDALFAAGPDTACRTVFDGDLECVSVPLADLIAVLTP